MKSNLPPNNEPTASAFKPPVDCFSTDSNTAALEVFADEGISYLLPYSQFLYGERTANPDLEQKPDAPPEKLLLHFALAEVAILGSGLKFVAGGVQEYKLKYVKSSGRRFDTSSGPHVATVTVIVNKEHV